MSLVSISPETFSNLKHKVVVIVGAATGIGAVAVTKLQDAGAKVVAGDIKDPETPSSSPTVTFVKTDVTNYASVLHLFKTAWSLHGRIDHVVSNAGLVEIGQLFATRTDDAAIEEAPTTMVLDVNMKGTIFVSRVAVHYLRKSLATHKGAQNDASLLLVSSVAGFGEYPGLFQYSASKHGVVGLFRSTRNFLLPSEGIRVNAVLPNMTRTQMVTGVVALYDSLGVPVNGPDDVANTLLHAIANDVNGEALYVSGAKTYEIEKKLDSIRAEWLGKDTYDELLAGQQALGGGSNWTDRKGGRKEDYESGEVKS